MKHYAIMKSLKPKRKEQTHLDCYKQYWLVNKWYLF